MTKLRDLGYAYELPLSAEHTLDDMRVWLRKAGILGEPSMDFNQLPDRVWFDIRSDAAAGMGAGMEILQIYFRDMQDALLFKLAFGGAA